MQIDEKKQRARKLAGITETRRKGA